MIPDSADAMLNARDANATRAARTGVWLVGLALLFVAIAAAISVDVTRTAYKVKSDEATYAAMTLSLAYDRDLSYQRGDLERFWGLYQQGPEGIFLKKGKRLKVRVNLSPPFVHVTKLSDGRADRLYFGKSMAYALAAAPFVRVLNMNGFYVFHVLLFAVVCLCGYRFLEATSEPIPALMSTLAFLGVSVVPIYGIFLMPDLFNFALVFVAYFFWLYKEVATPRWRVLRSGWSDVVALFLLAVASYSKPTNAPLIGPLVLLMLYRRQWRNFIATSLLFGLALGSWFGANALVTGEFNYQGGDRKTFYGSFPFESPLRDVWAEKTDLVTTNDADSDNVFETSQLASRVLHNVEYFLIGRHFGFVPYFFPGVVAILVWVLSKQRFEPWRVLIAACAGGATLLLLLFLPYTWSGGGGPPGNRYFLGVYPVLFFLMPRVRGWHGLLAFAGGALFTAKILVNPFVSAKNTWEIAERGFARRLPVELTMANDLPVMLAQPPRGHIPYRNGREVLLYFLDSHASPPEPVGTSPDGSTLWGMWVSGGGRADIIVRADYPIDAIRVDAESLISTVLTVRMGSSSVSMPIAPKKPISFTVPASGVRGWKDFDYLLSASSSEGFIPRLMVPGSTDSRNLGALVRFSPITSAPLEP
ncbi:MAG: hypothetical protein ABMA15_11010 [Vicinamibacterales bacterium]